MGPATELNLSNDRLVKQGQSILQLSQTVAVSEGPFVTALDKVYLYSFLQNMPDISLRSRDLLHMNYWPPEDGPLLPDHRLGFLRTSKPLLYAALSYAAFRKSCCPSIDTFRYLGESYKSLRDAISAGAVLDVVYACYTVLVLGFEMKEPLDTIITHLLGVFQAYQLLDPARFGVEDWEMVWMERLWQNIFHKTYIRLILFANENPSTLAMYIDRIYKILHCNRFSLQQNLSLRVGGSPLSQFHGIHTLGIYMHFYLLHYMLQCSPLCLNTTEIPAIEVTLTKVLRHMIESVDRIKLGGLRSDFERLAKFDFRAFVNSTDNEIFAPPDGGDCLDYGITLSLYFSAILVNEAILNNQHCGRIKSLSSGAAISLCKIVTLRSTKHSIGFPFEIRNLFLAGLVLTNSLHPTGTTAFILTVLIDEENGWIQRRLKYLIVNGIGSGILKANTLLLAEFLDEADRCPTLQSIWSLKLGQVYLWQCLVDLPPWFDGDYFSASWQPDYATRQPMGRLFP